MKERFITKNLANGETIRVPKENLETAYHKPRLKLNRGQVHPDTGKISISRSGSIYQRQKSGNLKRLPDADAAIVFAELAKNPVQKECGAYIHFYYCEVCGVSRNEPCAKALSEQS